MSGLVTKSAMQERQERKLETRTAVERRAVEGAAREGQSRKRAIPIGAVERRQRGEGVLCKGRRSRREDHRECDRLDEEEPMPI